MQEGGLVVEGVRDATSITDEDLVGMISEEGAEFDEGDQYGMNSDEEVAEVEEVDRYGMECSDGEEVPVRFSCTRQEP